MTAETGMRVASASRNTRSRMSRSCTEPTMALRSTRRPRPPLAHDGQLRDAVALEQVDGGADLVGGLHADHRRQRGRLAALLAQELADGRPVARPLHHPVLDHPRVVEDLRQVRPPAVRQDHEHRLVGRQLARHLDGDVHREAAGAADQQPLLARHPPRGAEGVAVGHGDPAVDRRALERVGPEVLADALDQVRPHERRSCRSSPPGRRRRPAGSAASAAGTA